MKIGVDIGGTEIKAGLVSNNKIIKKISVRTGKTKKEVIENIIKTISNLFDKRISLIGIGCPGPADYEKGIIGNTPNMPLKGVNLKKIISKRFSKKVLMTNDANCFVLGESLRLNKKNVVGLTLGTGVGGGIVIDKKLYVGTGNGGELGHCTIKYDYGCGDLNRGSLESFVSGKNIKKIYGSEAKDLKSKNAWNEIGQRIGIGISNLINTFDPEIIVLGGSISKSFDLFRNSMDKEIKKRAIRKVPVIKGKDDSAIIGAANLI